MRSFCLWCEFKGQFVLPNESVFVTQWASLCYSINEFVLLNESMCRAVMPGQLQALQVLQMVFAAVNGLNASYLFNQFLLLIEHWSVCADYCRYGSNNGDEQNVSDRYREGAHEQQNADYSVQQQCRNNQIAYEKYPSLLVKHYVGYDEQTADGEREVGSGNVLWCPELAGVQLSVAERTWARWKRSERLSKQHMTMRLSSNTTCTRNICNMMPQ